jgi:membrane fusion protein, copper/silver efflux system
MLRFVVLVLSVLLFACGAEAPQNHADPTQDTAVEHARRHLDPKYVCPMHPQIVRDEPGTCPICGMNLVLRQTDSSTAANPEIAISGAMQQAMNLRTAKVTRGTLWKYIKTVGTVQYDENRLVHVHPRAEGWVEKLRVRAEGDVVKRGDTLLELYAPSLLNAQVDFLIALKQSGTAAVPQSQVENARNRLRLLELPDALIKQLERTSQTTNTVPMLAPQNGIITSLNIREGMYVTPATELMTVADLSTVWVIVDVFETQLAWVEVGKNAEITVPAWPGKTWEGKVEYLYPDLDAQTRTLRVRLRFANAERLLKPNMFAEVVIYGGPQHDSLIIPAEALILTGERQAVIKAQGNNHFKAIDVSSGMRRGGQVEILSGLEEGDEIVVSGQFLIDSEANLQAAFARMGQD